MDFPWSPWLYHYVTSASGPGAPQGCVFGRIADAGVADHIHMHALPRPAADSNPATVIAETRVLPEALDVTWKRAKAEFERP